MKLYDKLFYDGQWQTTDSKDFLEVVDSATEEAFAKVVQATHADVDKAVASAKQAFTSWNVTPPEKRAAYVEKILAGIEKRQTEIADTIVNELGTSSTYAKESQLPLSIGEIKSTLAEFKKFKFEEEIDDALLIKEGFGVVACVTPWNYPLNQIQR